MQTPSPADPDPMGGYRTAGRLLLVGISAGGVIGGFVGGLALWSPDAPDHWVGGMSVGGALGIVLGLITQTATHAVVLGARRVRPSMSRTQSAVVAAVLPLIAVAGMSLWIVLISHAGTIKGAIIVGGAMTFAAAAVMLTPGWSLAHLSSRTRTS
ncbi:hypothetical protein [Georgenia yuyongxinii]